MTAQKENTLEQNNGSSKTGARGKKAIRRSLFDIFNGNILVNDKIRGLWPFVLFIAGVMIVYIANGYYAERKIRDINKINLELKELRSEYITSKSRLMYISKQSEVAKNALRMQLGIKESTVPPGKIIID